MVAAGILVAVVAGFWPLDLTGYGLNDAWVAQALMREAG